ncbi:YebC/PmpR family DNA-binding transcriptional regulator [Candidatus Shapirobacteria bacterium CG08_land_8_20_14_0_20_39_18]|uniref:Probable transcriptional regulatory protein COT44_00065 n=1 Tax=Candidatus Shapirobacteria bacterium CG08_land_8_20_14_0_20_39_18 TaxID=1974883 RepID=A0A2M6XEE6_9BACT|nr:MAG: YebC/PmpR family DNA-binding transcriptional regulator [Candidatus Shapirobacteria bacterium CG08_land_8_20_14_0_20_39_18]PIY66096.1 MAG: YebC/PmpR family DNA-binding transcriptional regulator [Candidatus Shapirobacteria bacterium CG_4_10_14_0_8_um_filter_39_15]PJE68651.1 MAG: YebC/PmpR family DNA-binding transcriptional regulator [Candidatus Shapirobacteria bacterium CG10_big_fil_rev_8_21_14_0_10_38_8]
MSGHSKWATIHRDKEITDAKKGQAWTRITNAIIVAVRESGGMTDPEKNFKLRLAMDKGHEVNMPKDNIDRAIARGSGEVGSEKWEEVTYEGYGPGGVAIMIETTTDNKNRTAQEVKNIFERGGGSLASRGAVAFQFASKGYIVLEKPANSEEAILKIMDLGVEDVEEEDDAIEIYTQPEDLQKIKAGLLEAGYQVKSYELALKPTVVVPISDQATSAKILTLMENLESQSDVQKVYANFDIIG